MPGLRELAGALCYVARIVAPILLWPLLQLAGAMGPVVWSLR